MWIYFYAEVQANVGPLCLLRVFISRSKSPTMRSQAFCHHFLRLGVNTTMRRFYLRVWSVELFIPSVLHSCANTACSVCSQVFSAGFQGKHGGISTIYFPLEYPPPPPQSVWLPRACGGFVCGIVADVHNKMTDSSQQQLSSKSLSVVLIWLTFPGLRIGLQGSRWLFVLLWFIPPEPLKSIINERDLGIY